MTQTDKIVYGLMLDLGGAPNTPHWVPGVAGLFRPDVATVVGGPGEVTLDRAREVDADPGVPLKLVKVPAGEVKALRERAQAEHQAHRGGVIDRRRVAKGLEVAHLRDATDHVLGKED